MRRIGVGAIVAAGLATAVLDVLLCLTLLGEVMRAEGAGFLAWTATLVLSGCFLAAASIVLLHCAADRGWCRPGWAFGLFYLLLVVERIGDHGGSHGSSALLAFVCSYLTTMPFQFAVWARRTAARPVRPLRPEPEQPPVWWPAKVRQVQQIRQVFSWPSEDAEVQQSRSAALAEESPSARGWNSVENRR